MESALLAEAHEPLEVPRILLFHLATDTLLFQDGMLLLDCSFSSTRAVHMLDLVDGSPWSWRDWELELGRRQRSGEASLLAGKTWTNWRSFENTTHLLACLRLARSSNSTGRLHH